MIIIIKLFDKNHHRNLYQLKPITFLPPGFLLFLFFRFCGKWKMTTATSVRLVNEASLEVIMQIIIIRAHK